MWVDREHYYKLREDLVKTDMAMNAAQCRNRELMKEIEELKQTVREERARADRAVDTQLTARGQAPIADPGRMIEADDPFVEDPEALAAMRKEMKESGALGLLMRELPENREWPVTETIGEE